MVSVCGRLRYILILTHFLSNIVVAEEVAGFNPKPNTLDEDVPRLREEIPYRLEKSSEHQTDPLAERIHRKEQLSKSVNLGLTTRELSGIETSDTKKTSEASSPSFPWLFGKAANSPSPAKKDEGSDSSATSGWGFLSTLSKTFGAQPPKRTRKPIEDVPILGSLISLGGAVGLAGQRGANLLADGGRKIGDLARGTLTKSGYKLPKSAPATSGLAHAIDGVSGLTRDELGAVVSAVSSSKGRTDFVKHLLEKSNPESAFRIGLAAASVHGLKSNPAFGSAIGLLQTLAN